MSTLWLVQRLRLRGDDERRPDRGFDGYFGLDYMGSAEYEFGTAADSLKAIRSEGKATVHPCRISGCDQDRLVYIVTSGDHRAQAAMLTEWLAKPASKERSYFPEHFDGTPSDYMEPITAWWAFGENFGWSLDSATADVLATAFNAPKPVAVRR